MAGSILYYIVKIFGSFVRTLPLPAALALGRFIGSLGYFFDIKRRKLVHANLKIAFSKEKNLDEIRLITRKVFENYGQNLIELFRLPLFDDKQFKRLVSVEGKEHIDKALAAGKGCILAAMHFGSWEMASVSCAMMGLPYKMFARPQEKINRLEELLNYYRSCGGQVVLTRGAGTRDFVKALKDNQIIGMVVDQGGRDGIMVPFLGRTATMSSGALRMALKMDVPILYSIIIREPNGHHRLIIHEPLSISNTGNLEEDLFANLKKITPYMESYIKKFPSEYMWFYKIWKYSHDSAITILFDGKTGHLRQSQAVARQLQIALSERSIDSKIEIIRVNFRNKLLTRLFSFLILFLNPVTCHACLGLLKWILTPESYKQINSVNADYIISCGSSIVGLNSLLSMDCNARNIAVLKPGLLQYDRFDRVIIPKHDVTRKIVKIPNITITNGAPNLITPNYLTDQTEKLQSRFSHLKNSVRPKIGVLIGGDSTHVYISLQQIKVLVNQLKEVCREINCSILVSTSRRTPETIDQYFLKTLKKENCCDLIVLPNREDVPEAVGGIMGVSDIIIVSGDSISMMSEAACSGKKTIVFKPETRARLLKFYNKHKVVIETLHRNSYIYATDVKEIRRSIYDLIKNKVQIRTLNDNEVILNAMRELI